MLSDAIILANAINPLAVNSSLFDDELKKRNRSTSEFIGFLVVVLLLPAWMQILVPPASFSSDLLCFTSKIVVIWKQIIGSKKLCFRFVSGLKFSFLFISLLLFCLVHISFLFIVVGIFHCILSLSFSAFWNLEIRTRITKIWPIVHVYVPSLPYICIGKMFFRPKKRLQVDVELRACTLYATW